MVSRDTSTVEPTTGGALEGARAMLHLEETFVYDAVTHSYNMAPSNYRNEQHAEGITEMLYGNVSGVVADEYTLTPEGFVRDWGVEETATMLFEESYTDMATFHPVPMYAFHDGLVANDKAGAVVDRWPDRFRSFACVDPLRDGWEDELEAQVEDFDPIGVKLYPSHWSEDHHEGWSMGDPEVAFPVFEKAHDLGIETVAIHKAIPFGPVPRSPYHPGMSTRRQRASRTSRSVSSTVATRSPRRRPGSSLASRTST